MVKGTMVTALLYGGGRCQRRVVCDKGDVIVICSEDEYQRAQTEGREPSGVGFPRADIIDSKDVKYETTHKNRDPESIRVGV